MKGGRNMEIEVIVQRIWELVTIYGIKVLAAIVIIIVGRWIAKGFRKLVKNVMGRRQVDKTITGFVGIWIPHTIITFRRVGDAVVCCCEGGSNLTELLLTLFFHRFE